MTVDNALRAGTRSARASRFAVLAILAAVALGTLASTAGRAVGLVTELATGAVEATLVAATPLPASAASPHLVSGVFGSADLLVRDLPAGLTALVAAAGAADLLSRLALAAAVLLIGLRVLRPEPFGGALAVRVAVAGGVVAIGALVALGTGVLRDWMLADLLTATGGLRWPTAATADPVLLPVGLGLLLLGLLLEHGRRLEDATEGLV